MKTNLTLNDLYLVRIGGALTTWMGDTFTVYIAGCPAHKIPFWGNKSDAKADIYFEKPDCECIECETFMTDAIRKLDGKIYNISWLRGNG